MDNPTPRLVCTLDSGEQCRLRSYCGDVAMSNPKVEKLSTSTPRWCWLVAIIDNAPVAELGSVERSLLLLAYLPGKLPVAFSTQHT